jgi:hypothetical protein
MAKHYYIQQRTSEASRSAIVILLENVLEACGWDIRRIRRRSGIARMRPGAIGEFSAGGS